jgi:superfamily II DNA helicase RecQ
MHDSEEWLKKSKKALKDIFDFDEFKDGQEDVLRCLFAGKSSAAIFPTG